MMRAALLSLALVGTTAPSPCSGQPLVPDPSPGFENPTLPSGMTLPGNCGQTPYEDCVAAGAKTCGAWSGKDNSELPKTLEACATKCLTCPSAKCTYISFSVTNSDCSWYESCDMSKLHTISVHPDYKSQVVRGNDSGGWTLVAGLLLGGVAYLGAGVVYGGRTGGGAGLAAHPHHEHFVAVQGLVADGLAFARGSKRGGGGGYSAVPSVPRSSSSRGGGTTSESRGSGKSPKGKRSRSEGGKGSKRRSGEKEERKISTSNAKDASPSAPAQELAAADAAASTASGGGGRWVHVPT
jgi:hypothetical protein